MMILDDDPQPWEQERNELIRKLAIGIPCMYGDLPVDTVFYGLGIQRKPIIVGVEVKKADDMADSIVRTGRLVQQFRNAEEFGCEHVYLCVQGEIRPSKVNGQVEVRKWNPMDRRFEWMPTTPSVPFSQWTSSINTMAVQAGITVQRTNDPYETASTIVSWYHWWQTAVDEHQFLDRFHTPQLLLGKAPFFRRVVKEVDGVGWTRSDDFMKAFGGTGLSSLDVLNQDKRVWQTVKGVGKGTADKMWEQLHEPIPGLEK